MSDTDIPNAQEAIDEIMYEYFGAQEQPKQHNGHAATAQSTDNNLLYAAAERYIAKVPSENEGNRDNAAFNLAGHLAAFTDEKTGQTLSESDVLALLQQWNTGNSPPLDDHTLRQKVYSAMHNGEPREPHVVKQSPSLIIGSKTASNEDSSSSDTSEANDTDELESEADKALVEISAEEHKTIERTIKALQGDDDLYQRGGALVRIVRGDKSDGISRPDNAPAIRLAPAAHLRERITRHVLYYKWDARANKYKPANVPAWATAAIESRGEWPGIRELVRVSDVPVLRPDGSIWQAPGHDSETGVLYEPKQAQPEPIPDTLTLADAQAATAKLLDVTADFPFAEEAHRAAYLAAMLTPLARPAFTGPTPGFLFDANIRGVGKTLLAQAVGMIGIGSDDVPVSSYAAESDEMRKRITSIALAGDPLVLLDNVEGVLGNDALDRALTTTRWRDRVLGKSEEVDLPLQTVWFATANNAQVHGDTSRRLLHIALDCLEERPEHRQGFQYPDLLGHVRQNRPQLVRAGLTVLAAYLRAGAPDQGLRAFGSFEGWAGVVRQAVVWCGYPDPCQTQELLADQADTTTDTLRQLLDAWEGYCGADVGYTVAELVNRLYPEQREYQSSDAAAVAMRTALEALTDTPHGRTPSAREVGNQLRAFRRRVVGGQYMDCKRTKTGNQWRLCHTVES